MIARTRTVVQRLSLAGLVTREAMVAAGLDPDTGTREVLAGRWLRLAPGTYLTSPGPPTADQLRLAALVHAGQGAVLAGPTAAELHGVRWVPEQARTHVLLPHERRAVATAYVQPHRSRARRPAAEVAGWPVVALPDSVVQCARWARHLRDARGVVLGAVHDRLCTVEELREAARVGGTRGLRQTNRALEDAVRGAASPPEAEAADLAETAALAGLLPPFLLNPQIWVDGAHLGDADLWFLGRGCGSECDSIEQHSGAQLQATFDRHQRFWTHRLELLHMTPTGVRNGPDAYVASLRALVARSGPEPAGLRVVPRGPLIGALPLAA